MANWRGHAAEIVRLLIERGADVNVQSGKNYENERETALMRAADADNLEIVRILLEGDANPNLKDEDGETALDKTSDEPIKNCLNNTAHAEIKNSASVN